MTGAMLRRLREAYGYSVKQVLGITSRRRAASGDDAVTELHYTGGRHG